MTTTEVSEVDTDATVVDTEDATEASARVESIDPDAEPDAEAQAEPDAEADEPDDTESETDGVVASDTGVDAAAEAPTANASADETSADETSDDESSDYQTSDDETSADELPVEDAVGHGYWTVNGIALRDVGGSLRGTVTLDARHGDGHRCASSGVVARLLDEILAVAVAPLRLSVATLRIEVEFLGPVPIDVPLAITTWVAHDQGRRIFCAATLQGAHGVVAQGHGSYLVVGDRNEHLSSVAG